MDWRRWIQLSWLISHAEWLDMDCWFVYISSGKWVSNPTSINRSVSPPGDWKWVLELLKLLNKSNYLIIRLLTKIGSSHKFSFIPTYFLARRRRPVRSKLPDTIVKVDRLAMIVARRNTFTKLVLSWSFQLAITTWLCLRGKFLRPWPIGHG